MIINGFGKSFLTLSIKNLSLKSEDPKIYYSLSHKLGIPQVNTEKLREKIFGLECNFEDLNGIDFKKGCYVGQENTARMKLKNKLRRKLLPLKSNEKLGIDSDITFNKINIGKVLINEPYPFGLIKLFDPNFSDFKNKEILADNKKVIIIIS